MSPPKSVWVPIVVVVSLVAVAAAAWYLLWGRVKRRHTDCENGQGKPDVSSEALVPLENWKKAALFIGDPVATQAESRGNTDPTTITLESASTGLTIVEVFRNPRIEYTFPDCHDRTANVTIDGAYNVEDEGKILDFDIKVDSDVEFKVIVGHGGRTEAIDVGWIFCHTNVDGDVQDALRYTGLMTGLSARDWKGVVEEVESKLAQRR